MSLVKIVHHDENIYTILAKPPEEPPKTPRYQSALEKQLKHTKIPQLRLTFGYAETPLTPPSQFLKKGHGRYPPRKVTDHKCFVSGNLPAVPKRPPPDKTERPKKNFKVINIIKAIKLKPAPFYEPRLVDTRDGHIKTLRGSGEVPEFCMREGFGKMPRYLVNRNRREWKEKEKSRLIEESRESACKIVSENERQKLLANLKQNWALMQKAFLQLPILTDTVPKIQQKTKMENELKQLEKDIQFVESNKYIYIYE